MDPIGTGSLRELRKASAHEIERASRMREHPLEGDLIQAEKAQRSAREDGGIRVAQLVGEAHQIAYESSEEDEKGQEGSKGGSRGDSDHQTQSRAGCETEDARGPRCCSSCPPY